MNTTKTAAANTKPSVAKLAVTTAAKLNSEGREIEKLASNLYYGVVNGDIVKAWTKDTERGDGKDTELKSLLGTFERRNKNEFTYLKKALAMPLNELVAVIDKRRAASDRVTALSLSFIDKAIKNNGADDIEKRKKDKAPKGKTEKASPFEALVQAAKNLESAYKKAKPNDDEMAIVKANMVLTIAALESLTK